MDLSPAHLHLVLNHVPVLGTLLFAPLVLLWGFVRRSRDVMLTGLLLAVLLALTAIPIYLTGEPAEEQLEKQPWMEKARVETHEERAEAGLGAVLITGGAALFTLWLSRRGRPVRRLFAGLVLVGLLVSALLFARAALAGGQIRHDELRRPPPVSRMGAPRLRLAAPTRGAASPALVAALRTALAHGRTTRYDSFLNEIVLGRPAPAIAFAVPGARA